LSFRLDANSYEGLVAALNEARLVLHREQALEQGHFSATRGQA
jgi:hypothetical protein